MCPKCVFFGISLILNYPRVSEKKTTYKLYAYYLESLLLQLLSHIFTLAFSITFEVWYYNGFVQKIE